MATDSLRPSAALAAYAEPWLEGRRVLVVGDASGGLADQLVDRGARLVHFVDADPTRLSEAATRNTSQSVSFAPLPDGSLALRDGAFNVAIVDDLAALADPGAALKQLRRALSASGVAVIASPNPEARLHLAGSGSSKGIDYYALYDLVAEHFEEVTMLGQTPFVGYAVASFAPEGEPEPTIDSTFVPGGAEEPEWFVAVASHRTIDVDEYAVVQLPFRQIGASPRSHDLERQLGAARTAERKARERMAELEAELTTLKKKTAAAEREGEGARTADVAELREQLAKRDAWMAQLEARAAAADARADEAQSELEAHQRRRPRASASGEETAALRERLDRATADLENAREEIERTRSALETARAEQARERERVRAAEADAQRRTRVPVAADDTVADEITRLEAALRERGHRIRDLENQLREAELTGRELLRRWHANGAKPRIEAAAPTHDGPGQDPGESAVLSKKLDALAELNARQQADLEAARWSIEELENRLDSGHHPPAEAELERARAELQRQATLIEQLRAERGEQGQPR